MLSDNDSNLRLSITIKQTIKTSSLAKLISQKVTALLSLNSAAKVCLNRLS